MSRSLRRAATVDLTVLSNTLSNCKVTGEVAAALPVIKFNLHREIAEIVNVKWEVQTTSVILIQMLRADPPQLLLTMHSPHTETDLATTVAQSDSRW